MTFGTAIGIINKVLKDTVDEDVYHDLKMYLNICSHGWVLMSDEFCNKFKNEPWFVEWAIPNYSSHSGERSWFIPITFATEVKNK